MTNGFLALKNISKSILYQNNNFIVVRTYILDRIISHINRDDRENTSRSKMAGVFSVFDPRRSYGVFSVPIRLN